MEVIKVKPWGKGQGDYVLINAADFDASKHELYEVDDKPPAKPKSNLSDKKNKVNNG